MKWENDVIKMKAGPSLIRHLASGRNFPRARKLCKHEIIGKEGEEEVLAKCKEEQAPPEQV